MAEPRQLAGDGNLSDAILLSTLLVAPTPTSAPPAIFRPEIEMDGARTRVHSVRKPLGRARGLTGIPASPLAGSSRRFSRMR